MAKAIRRLKKVNVSFISLVDSGANKKVVIYKSQSHPDNPTYQKEIQIKKYDEEKGIIYGIVYAPDEVDTQGDITTADVIEKMSYDFMKSGKTGQVDEQHDYVAKDHYVAESWITKADDSMFPDEPVGSWAVGIKIEDDETKEKIKKGEITGLSMAGEAIVEEIKKESGFKEFAKDLVAAIKSNIISPISKNFDDEIKNKEIENHVYALYRANDKVLYDEDIDDKKTAIIENVTQFLESFEKLVITKSHKINEGEEMKPEEIQEIVKTAITEAVKPLNDKIEALEKSAKENSEAVEKSGKELTERLEKVEKATPGSKQSDDEPPVEVEKQEKIWM